MVGATTEEEMYSTEYHDVDEAWLSEGLDSDLISGKEKADNRPIGSTRRSVEEYLEKKRLRKQLEEVFSDDKDP